MLLQHTDLNSVEYKPQWLQSATSVAPPTAMQIGLCGDQRYGPDEIRTLYNHNKTPHYSKAF
jgi:hypothetical protein